MDDSHVSLAHGNGGRLMRELIDEIFAARLSNPSLDTEADAVPITLDDERGSIMITTDGFIVQPLEYPGGDIGALAVHGTVNDLAVAGAVPKVLSVNAFIEEGLEIALLERLVASMASAAREAGVSIVAGDTKVLQRGEGGGVYFATTGIGIRPEGLSIGTETIQPGDALLVSGPVGDHGTAVMLAREQFGLRGELRSDSASVLPLTQALIGLPGLRFMRDPTRGGLATVAHDLVRATGFAVRLEENAIPVRDQVQSVCDMLGYDPYYLACEGRVVAVTSADTAEAALKQWRALPDGADAALIGRFTGDAARVVLETRIGGERMLPELEDDPLPRIC
jgi:hydrogenase expression/formation protein HypE